MCGIVGYIGKNAISSGFENLKKLEYRGYDSAGIACIKNNKIVVVKAKGYIENTIRKSKFLGNEINICIAHTRWATTGNVSTKNAHPQQSSSNRFAIVHNGIIENYQEIKNTLLSLGYNFKSDTDTEVIANLIEEESKTQKSVIKIIKNVTKMLQGSYAIAILDIKNPNKIFLAKKDMPLFVSAENEFSAISSSVIGLPEQASSYIMLENNDIAELTLSNISIYNDNKQVIRPVLNITEKLTNTPILLEEKHYMLKEILEIEQKLTNTQDNFYNKNNNYLHLIDKLFSGKKRIHLVACGTAYHACNIGSKLLSMCGFDSSCHIASEFKYSPPILSKDSLYIFVSQSGETADTLGSLKLVKDLGLDTLSITNVESSTMSHLDENHIFTKAGTEIAVASTKAYVCQCLIFYLITAHLNIKMQKIDISQLKINNIFHNLKNLKKLAKEVIKYNKVFFIGRNIDYITAMEGSLKLKEISYIMAESYPAGELKHGSLALIDQNSLSVIISTDENMIPKIKNTISEIKSRNGKILLVSPYKEYYCDIEVDYFYRLEYLENSHLYPLTSILPLQLISYYSSTLLGLNPDKPRNLAKSVTVE